MVVLVEGAAEVVQEYHLLMVDATARSPRFPQRGSSDRIRATNPCTRSGRSRRCKLVDVCEYFAHSFLQTNAVPAWSVELEQPVDEAESLPNGSHLSFH